VKVVSLLPAATETIVALGAADVLVGVSHSCDDPAVAHLPRITRTRVPVAASSAEIDRVVRQCLADGESLYTIDTGLLSALHPDLVVTQGLCDVCAVTGREVQSALCAAATAPRVLSTEPSTVTEVWTSIGEIGVAVGREHAAEELVRLLRARVEAVSARTAAVRHRPRVAFLEWLDPPMCGGHWNPELVALAGGTDRIGRAGQPSRTIQWQDVVAWDPEVLCVACCGYSVARSEAELQQVLRLPQLADLSCVRNGRIHVFDGINLFARPGPRLVESLEALAAALTFRS
jgi:iron complex transport system substrate-binding protein